jgi:hypothetical protein
VVKRGSRVTVGLTLKKKGRVSFEIRKGGRSLSKTTFPPEIGKVRLKFKAPPKPGFYRLIISVKPVRGLFRRVNTIFTVIPFRPRPRPVRHCPSGAVLNPVTHRCDRRS